MQILKLMPAGKDYLWGGTRLRKEYRKKIDLIPLAETWECSVHPDGLSIVENGKYRGQTLKDVIDKHPEFLGTKNQEMPVLIKFIDAMKDLSVQVHPYDDYARKYEGDNGKSEMWYVIDAEPGAELIFGFEHPVTKEILKEAVANGTLDKHLHKIKIQKGDVIYVPAGTVHGIGAGALIAEIQESSNVTYRVYDYNRTDKNGNKRELHFDKAVEVMNMDTVKESGEKRLVHYYPGSSREIICRTMMSETAESQYKKLNTTIWCYLSLILIPAGFGLTAVSKDVMLLVGGEEIATTSFSLQILSISLIFAIYGGLITSVYNITQGREKENLMATTVSAIINCGLNLYMIPKYSLYGAAFTTLLSELFVFVFCTLRAPNKKRFFDVDEIKNSILYAVVGSILVLLTTKVVYMLVECSALLRLIIAVALSAVVYITYLIIFKNKYTIDIVRNIMVKIKKKY